MSSTNKTTNYELSQFVETDKPAWLTDYNGDMRKLDTALKAVSDVADGASGGISSLTDRMTAAEGAITTNANDIDALEARADALEAGAQSTAGTIAAIQTEQTAQNLGIEAATELGYNLARPYDSASTYAVGAYVLFQNTLYKCITAVATGEAFDPAKWLAIKATDEIAAGGYTLPVASASQLGGVKVGSGLSISDEILSVANEYIDLSGNFTENSSEFYYCIANDTKYSTGTLTNKTLTGYYYRIGKLNFIYYKWYIEFSPINLGTTPSCKNVKLMYISLCDKDQNSNILTPIADTFNYCGAPYGNGISTTGRLTIAGSVDILNTGNTTQITGINCYGNIIYRSA